MAWAWSPSSGATGCVGGPRPGTEALLRALLALWGPFGAGSSGIYSCRRVSPGGPWSVHAEGRAVDLSCPLPPAALGRTILGALGESASSLGIQRVIYDRQIYDASSPGGEPHTGDDPHVTHLHIEQTRASAEALTYGVALSLLDQVEEEAGTEPMLIVAFRGAQWVVRGDLTGKVGISQSTDVEALLRVAGGRVYHPATLSEAIMARIPTLL